MAIRLIVFDFDGTLADSYAHGIRILHDIGARFALNPNVDPDAARHMSSRELMRALGIRFWRLPRLIRAFHARAAELAETLPLFPHIPDLLQALGERQYRLGILSSNREDVIRTCLRVHQLEERFEFIVGYPKLFGKAKILRRISRQQQLARDEMLYIGDEVRDIEAAQRARIPVIAVNWGFQAEPLLLASQPTHLARNLPDILQFLDHLANTSA